MIFSPICKAALEALFLTTICLHVHPPERTPCPYVCTALKLSFTPACYKGLVNTATVETTRGKMHQSTHEVCTHAQGACHSRYQ